MAERHGHYRTDADLERALSELGRELDYPRTPDLARSVRTRLSAAPVRQRGFTDTFRDLFTPRTRRFAYAAMTLIALAGLVLAASPSTRETVADGLGLSGVDISTEPTVTVPSGAAACIAVRSTPVGGDLQLGIPVTGTDDMAKIAGFDVLPPPTMDVGTPDVVYLLSRPGGSQLSYVYAPRVDLPEVAGACVGLLISQFQGHTNESFIQKQLQPGTTLELVSVNGQRAYWLSGQRHTFYYEDPTGNIQPESIRLAGNTLLWEVDGTTLRIESALPKDAVIRIAEAMTTGSAP